MPAKLSTIQGKNVLICEDEIWIALEISRAVEMHRGNVMGPHSRASSALAALAQKIPDAAILDFNLLDGDCLPLIERLDAAGVPVVVHSGRPLAEVLSNYDLETRSKPVLPEELIKAIVR